MQLVLQQKCDSITLKKCRKPSIIAYYLNCTVFLKCLHVLYKSRSTWSISITRNDEKSLGQVAFFVPLLAFCCKMMNSRMSLAVREGLSITTECPQFSSRSTLHPGKVSAITAAPETSTTWANAEWLLVCLWQGCQTDFTLLTLILSGVDQWNSSFCQCKEVYLCI